MMNHPVEKALRSMGASCVAGDLILNRTVVGLYRDGTFLPTPEGVEIANNQVDAPARVVAVEPAAPTLAGDSTQATTFGALEAPTTNSKSSRKRKAAQAEDAPVKDQAPQAPVGIEDLDDLLK